MNTKRIYLALMSTWVLLFFSNAAADEVVGVVGLYPVGSSSCMAVEISMEETLGGLSWYHNDGSLAFPKLLLIEGEPGMAPDLTNSGLVLDEITGESLAWGEVYLEQPVTSTTGTAYAVFFFPENLERIGEGAGGGPGLGYRAQGATSRSTFVSQDGLQWARFDPGYTLAVERIAAPAFRGGSGPVALSELGDRVDLPAAVEDEPQIVRTELLPPHPNPFNPKVQLAFRLANPGHVDLKVYDAKGRLVRQLLGEEMPTGEHAVYWLGRDEAGSAVASGVYYARLEADGQVHRKTLTLVR